MGIFGRLFPDKNERELRKIEKIATAVEVLSDRFKAMTDEQLRACTDDYRQRYAGGETLDSLLPEAFATVREAADRVLGMRHFHVQIIGGIALHQGRIAEMSTGEGKTLVATLPVYLNALTGKGVHVVTVNEYLAARDAEWMGKVYNFLGMSVGVNRSNMQPDAKREVFSCDIVYTTNNELGFDYLRDNMVYDIKDRVLRGLEFAIVDEVDSILIDEARTPLIISGRGEESGDNYRRADAFVRQLKPVEYICPSCGENLGGDTSTRNKEEEIICPECGAVCENAGDYELIEKNKSVYINERGTEKAEKFFNIDDLSEYSNREIKHYIDNALKARVIMKKEVNYLVVDGQVIIIDEYTGRQMVGRRFSNGLHQAIEAKEGVEIKTENKTLATITLQNFFRLYHKLSGMTGTAKTEEDEFEKIYNLDVMVIPTNKPVVRRDEQDRLYVTEKAKINAIVKDIKECHERNQPVLVGTVSVEKSEQLSAVLRREGIRSHNVLNAKYHDKEADIIAQAGRLGAITIATNMAGRGTDIMLGGNPEYTAKAAMAKKGYAHEIIEACTALTPSDDPEVKSAKAVYDKLYAQYLADTRAEKEQVAALGGLRIIGTERHDSRRIDNQLRGRSGRQGDNGSSAFYLSCEDDMFKRFAGSNFFSLVSRLAINEDEPIVAGIMSRQIAYIQSVVEDRHFSARKRLIAYDDVLNYQREIIYGKRNEVLEESDIHRQVLKMCYDVAEEICERHVDFKSDHRSWDYVAFNRELNEYLFTKDSEVMTPDVVYANSSLQEIINYVYRKCEEQYDQITSINKENFEGAGMTFELSDAEKRFTLQAIDVNWRAYIDEVDDVRQSIELVAYGHQDPVLEYKRETYDMFNSMVSEIKKDTVKSLVRRVFINDRILDKLKKEQRIVYSDAKSASTGESRQAVKSAPARKEKEVGRNEPCPCGSGKKYKNCCGK